MCSHTGMSFVFIVEPRFLIERAHFITPYFSRVFSYCSYTVRVYQELARVPGKNKRQSIICTVSCSEKETEVFILIHPTLVRNGSSWVPILHLLNYRIVTTSLNVLPDTADSDLLKELLN